MDNVAQRPVFRQTLTPPGFREALRDRRARRRFLVYWIVHPLGGALDYATHYALRWTGNIDFCSSFGAVLGRRAGRKSYEKYRVLARRNLERLRPDMSPDDRDAAVLGMFESIGRTMAEYSVLDRLISAGRVEIVGAQHLGRAAENGRGIVVAGLHLGNWELLGPVLRHLGYHAYAFYEPPLNRFRHRLVRACRERCRRGCFLLRMRLGFGICR